MIFPAEIEKKIIEDLISENYTLIEYHHAKGGRPYSMTIKLPDRRILFSVRNEKDTAASAFNNRPERRYRASIQTYNWFGKKSKKHLHINMIKEMSNDLSNLLEKILDTLYKDACIQDCLDDLEQADRNDQYFEEKFEKIKSSVLRNVK